MAAPRAYKEECSSRELVQASDPTLSNARCRGIAWTRRLVSIRRGRYSNLFVASEQENGNGIQVLTIGGEPYNGMQRAYGFLCYVHMGLELVLREEMFLEILYSFATPAKSKSVWALEGISVF